VADEPSKGSHRNQPKPALVVFPHEKDLLRHYPNNALPYRSYIPAVWEAARFFASEAVEIHIIGYSCPEADFPALESLLAAAQRCGRIVVRNPDASAICRRLKSRLRRPAPFIEAQECWFEDG